MRKHETDDGRMRPLGRVASRLRSTRAESQAGRAGARWDGRATPGRPGTRAETQVRRAAVLAMLLTLFLVQACASGSSRSRQTNYNLIDTPEIAELKQSGVRDLYELISRARPRWLQMRSARSLQLEMLILVYHHETRLGGLEVLRGYPLEAITSLRYLDAAQAGLLPGAGSAHVEGAVVISTSGRDAGADTFSAQYALHIRE